MKKRSETKMSGEGTFEDAAQGRLGEALLGLDDGLVEVLREELGDDVEVPALVEVVVEVQEVVPVGLVALLQELEDLDFEQRLVQKVLVVLDFLHAHAGAPRVLRVAALGLGLRGRCSKRCSRRCGPRSGSGS
ncbi:MAG: hypothetical protein AAF368_00360 [Planctomycetota bacterium]